MSEPEFNVMGSDFIQTLSISFIRLKYTLRRILKETKDLSDWDRKHIRKVVKKLQSLDEDFGAFHTPYFDKLCNPSKEANVRDCSPR